MTFFAVQRDLAFGNSVACVPSARVNLWVSFGFELERLPNFSQAVKSSGAAVDEQLESATCRWGR